MGICSLGIHPENIYGETSDECHRGNVWVDRRCSYSDVEGETQFLFLYGNLLTLNVRVG
jgi:hypothetical protein